MALPHLPLQGRYVRLEPLEPEHLGALCTAGDDESLFRWYPMPVRGAEAMQAFIASALQEQALDRARPFVIRTRHDDRIVGTTRFGAVEVAHARGEIGWTWLNRSVQRTPVNTECKRLLLALGFETLGFNRVEFKTDSRNAASRAALLRIGAVEEGTFRNHMIMPDGVLRHSVYYSIIREEWPAVRARLDARLAADFSFNSLQG